MKNRREFIYSACLAAGGLLLAEDGPIATAGLSGQMPLTQQLQQLEHASGGRLGVAMLAGAGDQHQDYRGEERFPMCSTLKVLAVAATLSRVDQGQEHLDRRIPIRQTDILEYEPVTKEHVNASGLSIQELCAAAITLSDNSAANLLLASLGGPSAVTSFARRIGDPVTRLDRTEPTLNEALAGDPRDTTTPVAMARNLRSLILGDRLSPSSRALLKMWMVNCQTGDKKIRAGLPSDCTVADKTGSGEHNTSNDVAVVWAPERSPIVLTTYLTGSGLDLDGQAAILARAASACWQAPVSDCVPFKPFFGLSGVVSRG